jgi:pyrimidine-nucleoside phosphorylase
MMAGRGLGHRGGTIDKLESIAGYRTDLSVDDFQHIVQTVGCAITTTGPDVCPADKKLYALRDRCHFYRQ